MLNKKILLLIGLILFLSLNTSAITQLNLPEPSTQGGIITLSPYVISTHDGVSTTHLTQYGERLLKEQEAKVNN